MKAPARPMRKRTKVKVRGKKKDPIFIDGERPRPMYVDYKDLELLSKLTNRQGKIVSRRKSGCTAASQHAVTSAIKRVAVHGPVALRGRIKGRMSCADLTGSSSGAKPPFHTTRRVEFRDTDAAGIIHFSAFFFYMESAEHELLRHLGLSVLTADSQGAISWPRVSVTCDFTSAVRFEDMLDIEVRIARLGERSITYEFAFSCAGRAVAKGKTVAVCCRFPPGAAPQSIPIPADIAAKLGQFVS